MGAEQREQEEGGAWLEGLGQLACCASFSNIAPIPRDMVGCGHPTAFALPLVWSLGPLQVWGLCQGTRPVQHRLPCSMLGRHSCLPRTPGAQVALGPSRHTTGAWSTWREPQVGLLSARSFASLAAHEGGRLGAAFPLQGPLVCQAEAFEACEAVPGPLWVAEGV